MRRTRHSRQMLDSLESRQHLTRNQVVGYLPDYFYGSQINLAKIDWSALTQINYFAVVPSAAGAMTISATKITQLNEVVRVAHAHGVKVSIVLGGAGQDGTLQTILGNETTRNALAANLNTFQSTYHVDGVDIDWEPLNPTAAQIDGYGRLIEAVQTNTSLIVSAAVNPELLPLADQPGQSRYVLDARAIANIDVIGVMTYDLDYANHALYGRSTNDVNTWANYLAANGQSKEKLLMGVPFYGRAGTGWNNSQTRSYKDLVNAQTTQNGTAPAAGADSVSVRFPDVFGNSLNPWYFDGKTTIANKTNFALDNAIGGVMIWDLAQDHTDANLNYTSMSLLPVIRDRVNERGTSTATDGTLLDTAQPALRVKWTTSQSSDGIGAADLVLTNTTTGQIIDTATRATVAYDAAAKAATWSFTSGLPDGNYHATLAAGSIRDAASNAPMANSFAFDFHILAGDIDRDRTVGFNDLLVLAKNYGQANRTPTQGDLDGNGTVEFDDLLMLAKNYGHVLPTAAATTLPMTQAAKHRTR